LLEWSAPEGSSPLDVHALAAANPTMGGRIEVESLLADGATALAAGGDALATHLNEVLCLLADNEDEVPFPEQAWAGCLVDGLTMDAVRDRVIVCLDVSPDSQHVSLVAAGQGDDGVVLVEVVAAWKGDRATEEMRSALPDLLRRVRPKSRWFFPAGPAAQLRPDLERWKFESFTAADTVAACMGLAELVRAGRVRHGGDPLLTDHMVGAKKWPAGDGWRIVRRGAGHVDAAYAAAGAVLKARKPVVARNVHFL